MGSSSSLSPLAWLLPPAPTALPPRSFRALFACAARARFGDSHFVRLAQLTAREFRVENAQQQRYGKPHICLPLFFCAAKQRVAELNAPQTAGRASGFVLGSEATTFVCPQLPSSICLGLRSTRAHSLFLHILLAKSRLALTHRLTCISLCVCVCFCLYLFLPSLLPLPPHALLPHFCFRMRRDTVASRRSPCQIIRAWSTTGSLP